MKPLEFEAMHETTPLLCQRCGSLMRLVGSEPHPVEVKTDLLTYACTGCGDFQVVPLDLPTK
jgi:DNA-directed RNA polymerase subunit RPC12/RpoP